MRAIKQAITAIETLLASAVPHPVEHPTMTAAWRVGSDALVALKAANQWIPIEQMDDDRLINPAIVGMWARPDVWVEMQDVEDKKWAMNLGYTHFYIPITPDPPVLAKVDL